MSKVIPIDAGGIRTTGMIDLETAKDVELEIDAESKLWVNVDGVCRLRIGKIENIHTKLHNFLKDAKS